MDVHSMPQRRVQLLPAAVLQIVSSVMLAVSTRMGVLHIGFLCIALAGAMFAVQILASKNYWYFAVASVSVCAAFLIGGVLPFLMSAFAVPAGALLAAMIRRKSTKISVSAALEVLYIVLFALLFLLAYMLQENELSVNAVVTYFSETIDSVKAMLLANISAEVLEQMAKMNGVSAEEFLEALELSFEFFKLILPALLIAAMGVLAYVTAALFKFGTVIAGCELVLPDPKWSTLPSKMSAVLFAVAYIVFSFSTMFSADFNVVMVVCISIVIILAPIMLLMGVKWIKSSRNKTLMLVLLAVGLFFATLLAVMILAFFGVVEVFKLHDKMKKQQTPEN